MGAEERTRDEAYWRQFAETGLLPDLPTEIVDGKGAAYVQGVLGAPYNDLSKVLLAEVLAVRGDLSPEGAAVQCTAAKWVRVKILSRQSDYPNREAMREAFDRFTCGSANPLLARVGGLAKAAAMVDAKVRDGVDARSFAGACLQRLDTVASEDARIVEQDAFVGLIVAIGWVFAKARDYGSLDKALSLVTPRAIEGNAFLSDRVAKLRDVLAGAALQPLRDWPSKAKAVYHEPDCTRIPAVLQDLAQVLPNLASLRGDANLRNLVLFWISALLAKMKKQGPGPGANLGELVLEIVQADGLEDLPAACWERKVMDPPPPKGDGVFPATAEKLVNGVYGIVKARYVRQAPATPAERTRIEWLLARMQEVYARLPDEKWGDFRIGRLLILLGRNEEAKARTLPAVRRNQTQFWAWSALGDLFPAHRAACLARALLCKDEEEKLARVRRGAVALGLPVDDPDALRQIAQEASELLLEGLPQVRGVLGRKFTNKEGKDRVQFILEGGMDVRPVSPGAIRLPRRAREGEPYGVFLDEGDPTRILAVRPRAGELWDVLAKAVVTYYGRSRKGNAMLASETFEATCPLTRFEELERAPLGTSFEIRYSTRTCDFGTAYDIRALRPFEGEGRTHAPGQPRRPTVGNLVPFEGEIHLPNGLASAGFVGSVYVPPNLLDVLVGRGLSEGVPVCGRAVRLPPRMEQDRFGRPRKRDRIQAITLEVLGGEALARYRTRQGGESLLEDVM